MAFQPERAREIFLDAVPIESPAARSEFLDRSCGEDAELRHRVEALIAAHERPESLLDKAAIAIKTPSVDPAETGDTSSIVECSGTVIGPYKLLQPIGEGGMGTVYMAEQTQPVRRTVALKLIKAGMDSRQVLARFGAERQALALMDHPSIAKVFDAGSTETGRPYFVMELVKGIPITRFCDERRLTTRERLELVIPVCHAVQHAHQKGIIHRDLKPSNVLIALYDGKPVPKIIDFGVAKATGPRLTDQTLYTEFGSVVGTLEYMSPEQAELNQLDIDTRSDIYSLGVLLYELLTGSTPLDRKRLRQGAFLEMLRVIREEESPRPSHRLSTTEELPSIAACRNSEPRKLRGLVRGELDWIVMKALEKDRNRRYETANGLAADLRRHLDDEPVRACPPTLAYRLSKFARKYQAALATACAFAVVLVVATAISVWQAVRARRAKTEAIMAYVSESQQRREAQDQRDRAMKAEEYAKANLARARSAVDDYLTTISENRLLKSPLPGLQPLRKELLTTALRYYADFVSQNRDDPVLQADLAAATFRVGDITDQIGSKDEALKAFQTASGMYESLVQATTAPANRSYRAAQGRCLVRMAMIEAIQGMAARSLRTFERAIEILGQLNRENGKDPQIRSDLALANHYLALQLSFQGHPEESRRHIHAAIDLRSSLAEEFPNELSYRFDLALSLNNLAQSLSFSGQPDAAFESVRRANTIQRALVKDYPDDPQLRHTLALSTRGMATILMTLGRWQESKPLFVESGELMNRIVAENPAVTEFRRVLATGACEYGQHLIDHGEIDAGLNALDVALNHSELVRKTNPSDFRNLKTLSSIHRGIGKTLAKKGKPAEALESLRRSIDIGETITGQDYDLACGLALYSEVAGQVPRVPGSESNDSSKRFSDKAMRVLQKAVDGGYREVDWIERDPELLSLHSRADFKALIKTLRQKPRTSPAGQ
jgi:eukaryotic-like serine/threonine-protein kinase